MTHINPTDTYTFAGSVNPTSARIIRDLDTAWEASGRLTDDGESAENQHFGMLFARLFVRYPEVCRRVFSYLTDDEFEALECSVAECDIASARGRVEDDYDAVRHDIVNRMHGEVLIAYDVTVSDREGGWQTQGRMASSPRQAALDASGDGKGHDVIRVTMRLDREYRDGCGVFLDAGTDD
jgi:hypothetical protein